MNDIKNDTNLRQAVSRREQQLPPMPADLNERLMQRIEQRPRPIRKWLSIAASLLIIIGIGAMMVNHRAPQAPPPSPPKISQAIQKSVETITPQPIAAVEEKPKLPKKRKRTVKQQEIPDTLGNGIWQSERNVMRAMQMLSECEAVIQKSEQEMRNTIVKCTYNATPQPANVILVTNENGDCYVSDTNEQTIIEI